MNQSDCRMMTDDGPRKLVRFLTSHYVKDEPLKVGIAVLDEPGPGGASHHYRMMTDHGDQDVIFQRGPVHEAGPNGVAMEALLAIVIDRLEGFQAGKYPCDENQAALMYVGQALEILKRRTRKRIAAGTEGTSNA